MSFNLSISGHIDDSAVAEEVDALVKAAGASLVEALAAFPVSGLYASFSGPSGSEDLAAVAEEPVEDDSGETEASPDPEGA